jgi:hypothetical protein
MTKEVAFVIASNVDAAPALQAPRVLRYATAVKHQCIANMQH